MRKQICEDFKTMYGLECASKLRMNWKSVFNHEILKFLKSIVNDIPTKKFVYKMQASNGLLNYNPNSIVYALESTSKVNNPQNNLKLTEKIIR